MPKNINIQEGGDPKYMNEVKYIMTNLQGSGTCLWVPVDDVKLGTKTITKNGSYSASKSGFYGFEKVIVNVPGGDSNKTNNGKLADEDGNEAKDGNGNSIDPAPSGGSGSSVSGTDPDDGNDYKVDVDENGNLKKTKLPSRIVVTRNPDKMEYNQGDTFNPSGIIVHAYYGDDTDYGTIMNSELGYSPMEINTTDISNEYTDGDGVNCLAIHRVWQKVKPYYGGGHSFMPVGPALGIENGRPATIGGRRVDSGSEDYEKLGTVDSIVLGTRYTNNQGYTYDYFRLLEGTDDALTHCVKNDRDEWWYPGGIGGLNKNAFTAYGNYLTDLPESTKDPNLAGELSPVGGKATITVNWNRPADNKVLTTSIEVTVTRGTNTGGGSSSDSGGGGSHGF